MWKQLEPELYFHTHLEAELTAETKTRISESLNQSIQSAFRELYESDVELEITFEDGSIIVKAKLVIKYMVIALVTYAGVRSGVDYLSKDIPNLLSYVREEARQQPVFGEEIAVQRRLGVIARIDETLRNYESGRITRTECIRRLTDLLEIVHASPERATIIPPLARYITNKYGDAFDWEDLANRLPQNAILPTRRSRRRKQ